MGTKQFHIPLPLSVVVAYHVARGSVAWVPVENDPEVEVGYWIEHRRLVGNPNKASFVEAMTALHSHLFDLPAERMRESAEWRIKANNTVDLITGGLSTDPATDWAKLEDELGQCSAQCSASSNAPRSCSTSSSAP